MGLSKPELKREFGRDWQRHYQVALFRERGFTRRQCPRCGKSFWTLDSERKLCGDATCEPYGFIVPKPKKADYVDYWKKFERFWVRHGHEAVGRYPVICRWRDDLYFTVASIVDFQRWQEGKITFEYPAEKLVVPQVSLRFGDIPNVGVTGRHLTGFVMAGQHAFGWPKTGYWKDECIALNFELLTREFGIPEAELTYVEDLWAMPDFSAFGPSMEVYAKGLELVNNVFMQFTHAGDVTAELETKVIDVGWGFGRVPWYFSGAPTLYDVEFGPVVEKLKKLSGVRYDADLFLRYARIAGALDIEEVRDLKKARAGIARQLGVDEKELAGKIEPMQALYALADHSRTLAFAAADGGLPSNAGGGYNLRVILRRSLGFIDEFGFPFKLEDIADMHASYLKAMFPELHEHRREIAEILGVEERKYRATIERTRHSIRSMLNRIEKFDEQTLTQLYESQGITPELIERVSRELGKPAEVPEDFYAKMTERHITVKAAEGKEEFDVSGIKPTELLFYPHPKMKEFTAKVVRAWRRGGKDYAALDRTAFFAESGGQHPDAGLLDDVRVVNVQKQAGIVIHELDRAVKEGTEVRATLDWDRRSQLMKHHTAAHIVNGAARKVLGEHIWQAGAEKSVEKARLDVTHYDLPAQAQQARMEKLANDVIARNLRVHSRFMPRPEAEKKFGFRLYQGGAVPGRDIRVVEIPDFDVEACGGVHCEATGEVGRIKIIGVRKVQDGIIRFEFVAGERLCKDALDDAKQEKQRELKEWQQHCDEALAQVNELRAKLRKPLLERKLPKTAPQLTEKWKELTKEAECLKKEVASAAAEKPFQYIPNVDMRILENIGRAVVKADPRACSLLVSEGVVFAAAGPQCTCNVEAAAKEAARVMGGSAGGRDGEFRGGGPLREKAKEAFAAAKKLLSA